MSHVLVMVSLLVLYFFFHFIPFFVGPGDAVGSSTVVMGVCSLWVFRDSQVQIQPLEVGFQRWLYRL